MTKGGAAYSIDATGVVLVLKKAWECLQYGGTVVSLGNPGPGIAPPFGIHDMVNTGKAWRGCVEGDSNPPEFIPFLIRSVNFRLQASHANLIRHLLPGSSTRGNSRSTASASSTRSKTGTKPSKPCASLVTSGSVDWFFSFYRLLLHRKSGEVIKPIIAF